MENKLTISLPATVSKEEIESIQNALKEIEAVVDAGTASSRGIDPATVMVWFEVAGGILGAISTAILVFQRIRAMIRGKGITGATIRFADGTEISVDNATPEEIERILREVGGK
jgi:hypothetical protein